MIHRKSTHHVKASIIPCRSSPGIIDEIARSIEDVSFALVESSCVCCKTEGMKEAQPPLRMKGLLRSNTSSLLRDDMRRLKPA